MGLAAGFLGLSCFDERVSDSLSLSKQAGVDFKTIVTPVVEDSHPNTYKIIIDEGRHTLIALSTGMISIVVTS